MRGPDNSKIKLKIMRKGQESSRDCCEYLGTLGVP
jgi:hypothetical protein